MAHETPFVPPHLRRFVVEQDYGQYTAMDQAVWRFVLLQMQARLSATAHPTYAEGLGATGMSVDRIPRVGEMNERLSRFGWGAVCVDGFVPPRAFQEFQAHGILPIAAEIRTRQHLPYTPAPDILHEAAGHAPILPDPTYARYLRRIGQLGAEAFTVPADDTVFQAVYALSEIKEDPAADAHAVSRAEDRLQEAVASVPEASPAARLSRLYWWTAEYGLVGRLDDYKLYGAGLLSSLGESHSCHDPAVRKLPLDERCVDVGFDITRPQPQLFVAPSFEALHDVLEQVERTLRRGGVRAALASALRSRELASVQFSSGLWAMGVLAEMGPSLEAPAWLVFEGPLAFSWDGEALWWSPEAPPPGGGRPPSTKRQVVVTGRLADGRSLEGLSDAELDACREGEGTRHRLTFASGATVEARLDRCARRRDGQLAHLELSDVQITLPGRAPCLLERTLLVAAGEQVVTARAGAVASSFHGQSAFSPLRVPRPRALPEGERRLLELYERAERAAGAGRPEALADEFAAVHAQLGGAYREEWLLRWNLLETLGKSPNNDGLKRAVRTELERLEVTFGHRQPIASGLRYLLAR